MTPLEIFRSIWADTITLPLLETVNWPADTKTFPDEWAGVVYQCQQRPDVTLGSNPWVEEQGIFLIGLLTKSGKGHDDLDAEVAEVRQGLHGAHRDDLVLTQVDGPHDVDPEGMGEWWQVVLTAPYTFQTRRNATGSLMTGWNGLAPGFKSPPLPPKDWAI